MRGLHFGTAGVGEFPQTVEGPVDVTRQGDGIEGVELRDELTLGVGGQDTGGEVTVPGVQGKGQAGADEVDRGADAFVPEAPDRLKLGPGRRDVEHDEGGEEELRQDVATVQDEIALDGARVALRPFTPRLDG